MRTSRSTSTIPNLTVKAIAELAGVGGLMIATNRRFVADLLRNAVSSIDSKELKVLIIDGVLPTDDEEVIATVERARTQGCSVLTVCTPSNPLAAAAWVEIGANAVLTDDAMLGDLTDAIERLQRGEVVLGVSVREGLLSQLRQSRQEKADREAMFVSLTRREREVLELLGQGACPEDVAKASYVSLNTVRTQIRGILAKLDVGSVVAAVSLAYRSGWLNDGPQ